MQSNPLLPDEDDAKFVMLDALQHNIKQLEMSRSFLLLCGGCVAGVLNVTSLRGLMVFLVLYLTVVLGVAVKVGFDFKNYANNTFLGFLMNDLSKHALSFVLFWTLTYALVYIY
jgi:ER membrane protein complex subunit 6